ncbi:MAG: AAA family ATPase, partial [bacterium]
NEYNFINFYLNKEDGIDYDDLDFNHPLLNEKSNVKVHWTDLSANINFENELKIRKYFKNVHNLSAIKVDRNRIYTDVSNVEMVSESIDILDSSVHRKIFIEFLEINGYKKDFIEKVLKIDDIITERLNIDKDNLGIVWDIEKIWFNNFKSYGDGVIIDFKDMGHNALIQVGGENQQGKTSILDAISYILYGKTTTTLKREKNGDNRYINNKRDLDHCDGGAQININGNIFTVIRKTERKWNRAKTEISSCSTVVDYYKGTDITEDNKLTGEDKNETQTFIENAIGNFDDFIRLILTTADNINEILSMDRAVFIDSIIKDAGYDIFEKKLTEFKDYKKIETKDDIKIDLDKYKKLLEEKEEDLLNHIQNKKRYIDEIKELEDSKIPFLTKKDELLTDIDKIDEKISNLDISELSLNIETENGKIFTRKEQLKKIEDLKLDVLSYDADKIKNKRTELSDLKDIYI